MVDKLTLHAVETAEDFETMKAYLSTGNVKHRHTEFMQRSVRRMRMLGAWLWAVELDLQKAGKEAMEMLDQNEPDGIYVQLQQRRDLRRQEFLHNAFDAMQEALAGFVMLDSL